MSEQSKHHKVSLLLYKLANIVSITTRSNIPALCCGKWRRPTQWKTASLPSPEKNIHLNHENISKGATIQRRWIVWMKWVFQLNQQPLPKLQLHHYTILAKNSFETGFWCPNQIKPYDTKSLQFKCKFFNSFDILKLVWFCRGRETHKKANWLYVKTFINPCNNSKDCHIFGKGSTNWLMEWAGDKARQWSELGPIMSRKKCNRSHRKCKK